MVNKKTFGDVKINKDKPHFSIKKDGNKINISESPIKYDVEYTSISSSVSYNKEDSKNNFFNKLNKKNITETHKYSSKRISQTPQMPNSRRPMNKIILSLFIISLLVGILYLLSTIFYKADIVITPKVKSFELKNSSFIANRTNGIPFEVMVIEDTDIKEIILTSTKEVSTKAKAEITLYNEYTTKPIKIVAGSYIADEKGKTYKTDTTVSIPGYTTLDKQITPGQVSLGATAFLPGDIYNGEPKLLSITSFKSTDKYKKVYGKAKSAFTGGSSGLIYILDDSLKNFYTSNTKLFKDKLIRKLVAQVPDGYILYPSAMNFTYDIGDNIISKSSNMELEIKGVLSAVLIKKDALINSIITELLPKISDQEKREIIDLDLSSLSFDFTNKNQIISKDINDFAFVLNGTQQINWTPDIVSLKSLLLGKTKSETVDIFKNDPGITSASIKIFPFWIKIIPNQLNHIYIQIKNLTTN